jgi:hypothetical protein
MNDKAGAAKLIKLTAILQPELGGTELKQQFMNLLQKAEKKLAAGSRDQFT